MPIQAIYAKEDSGWTPASMRKWAAENGYKPIKPLHRTKGQMRYRLAPPGEFKTFSTTVLDNGIHLVHGYR